MKGLLIFYPDWVGRESLLTVLILFSSPFVTLYLATQLLPPWDDKKSHAAHARALQGKSAHYIKTTHTNVVEPH